MRTKKPKPASAEKLVDQMTADVEAASSHPPSIAEMRQAKCAQVKQQIDDILAANNCAIGCEILMSQNRGTHFAWNVLSGE